VYDDADHSSSHSASGGDDLSVTVDGENYDLHADYDVDKDGHNDTAVVQTDNGGAIAFTDADGDGDADVAVEVDDHGNVVGAARYDESSGQWIAVDPKSGHETGGGHQPSAGGTQQTGSHSGDHSSTSTSGSNGSSSSHGEQISVDVPGEAQDRSAGEATVDVDHDGKDDTAVVTASDGTVMAFTDVDGDGKADVLTMIDTDGSVTVSQHTGEDEWTEVESGHVDSSGNYTPDSGSHRG
jgi:hypothetical protein